MIKQNENSNTLILISLVFLIGYYFFPLISVLFLFVSMTTLNIRINYFYCFILLVFSLAPYISSKTGISYIGNDKAQYIDYIDNFTRGGFLEVIKFQPEVVSFGLLKILGAISNTNVVFFVYFFVSFALLFSAIYLIDRNLLPLFFLIFFASSYFLVLYGNVIRQGLALSFFLLSISQKGWKKYFLYTLAIFSHFSVLLFLIYLSLDNIKLKNKLVSICFLSFLAFFLSNLLLPMLSAVSVLGLNSFSHKALLYIGWGDYDISGSLMFVYGSLLLTCLLFFTENRFLTMNKLNSEIYQKLSNLLVFSFPLLIFLSSIPKIFERFFLYVAVIDFLFIAYFLCSLKVANLKLLVCTIITPFLFFLGLKRFHDTAWYFNDNAHLFLETNLYNLLSNF
ncbi:MAG: hypothetical protein ACJAZQ_001515 [Cognaticolwellia sp.]|jgi:hypothetical protein